MSTTLTTHTTTSQTTEPSPSTFLTSSPMKTSMADSGFSSSLRLTLNDASQSSSIMTCSISSESQPAVSMPDGARSTDFRRQDSGLCTDLMNRLSLSDRQGSTGSSSDVWREYYEPDDDGDVQLHLAIASGYLEVVDSLIRMAPTNDFLSIQNNQMYAPLHIAVLRNHPAIVRRLVVAGARLDVRDREGNTPLHLAARRGHVECGEALLRSIANQEISDDVISRRASQLLPQADVINMPNYQGEHAVHLATMGGHVAFLQFLCWNNADMNAQEGRAGRTSLHFAVGARNLAAIQCLIEPKPRGCGADPNMIDWYGRTAFQLSLMNATTEVTQYLATRAGIDLSGIDSEDSIEDSDYGEAELAASILLNSNA